MKKQFPIKDGWLHAGLKIQPGTKLTRFEVLEFCTAGPIDEYEIGFFKHFKTIVRICFRRRSYNFCTLEFHDGRIHEAKVWFDPDGKVWNPSEILIGDNWINIEDFESECEENINYSASNYRYELQNHTDEEE